MTYKMKKYTLIGLTIFFLKTISAQQYFGTTVFGNAGIETNYDMAVDSQGNIFSVGLYTGSLTVGTTTVNHNGGNADAYLTKHDSEGNPLWIKSFGGQADDVAITVAVDSNDDVILSGYFQGSGSNSFDADPGPDVYQLSQTSIILSRDCFIVKVNNDGDFIWARQVSNPSGGAANEDATSIKIDNFNNIYIVGSYNYADFDTGPGQDIYLSTDNGNHKDGFVLKINNYGDYQWVKTFKSADHVVVTSIDIDDLGNLYLAGRYEGILDMDPSNSVQNSPISNGSFDAFLVKLDLNGNFIWGIGFGGAGYDNPNFVKCIDTAVYIGGTIIGNQDLDPSSGFDNQTVLGSSDGYVAKYNQDGSYLNSYKIGGSTDTETEEVYRVLEGPNGNLFLTGSFLDTTDFNNGSSTAISTSNGNLDAYILEITPNFQYVNHLTIGDNGSEKSAKVIFNSNNAMIFTGVFSSSWLDFNPYIGIDSQSSSGNEDVFVSKFEWPTIAYLSTNKTEKELLNIYPNPTKNIINISNINNFYSYKVYNSLGQIVKQNKLLESQINISDLTTGIYTLELIGKYKTQNTRFLKK